MKLPDGITINSVTTTSHAAQYTITASTRAMVRLAVERWIDSQHATLICRHDVQDPVSRERAIELFVGLYLSIATSLPAASTPRGIVWADTPELRQVGWIGPYGLIPGGMDTSPRDDWEPVYVQVKPENG